MDSRDWLFEHASSSSAVPLPTSEELFILPPTVSTTSLWNSYLTDINFPVEALQHLSQSQEPLQPEVKLDDQVSDVTDAQISTSPTTTRLDPSAASPFLTDEVTNFDVSGRLKPKPTIAKQKGTFMPALSIGIGRGVLNSHSNDNTSEACSSGSAVVKVKEEKTTAGSKRPSDDSSRQRHNQMMRENRERFNKKFKDLTDLLQTMKVPQCEDKPMKNKIQILERAMCQYALMESQRAQYKNQLLFTPPASSVVSSYEMDVIASTPSLEGACELVVRSMCCSLEWKYGEVWICNRDTDQLMLKSAFVSPKNMPTTREKLESFAQKGKGKSMDKFFVKSVQYKHAVWISNFASKGELSVRAREAFYAGITTLLYIPVSVGSVGGKGGGVPDAVVVVMHADDELLSHVNGIRPYDSESICRLTDLCSAVVETRSHLT